MDVLRTPDDRFEGLSGYRFEPRYVDVDGLRMHYVDEGSRNATPVLLLHGEPTWAYLYRHMIPVLIDAGYRAIAIDFVGFGRSDKPADPEAYTYQAHIDWLRGAMDGIGLDPAVLFGQDWGGLIGLRVAAEEPDRFDRIVAANTFLPTGDRHPGDAFLAWQRFSQETPDFTVGRIVNGGCTTDLSPDIVAAYDAPFPDESYKEGARQFPLLVPASPDDPAAPANRKAWEVLAAFEKPVLTAFGDSDAMTRGADRAIQERVPGAKGQPHTTIEGAGHFIQEDKGEELARVTVEFIRATPG
jgi:haloalkane dehalogenase